jgi:hypothetical protein
MKGEMSKTLITIVSILISGTSVIAQSRDLVAATPTTAAILTGYCDSIPYWGSDKTVLTNLGAATACSSQNNRVNTGIPMPSAGLLKNLWVTGGIKDGVTSVFVNGVASPLHCTGVCHNARARVKIKAGDLVSVRITGNSTALTEAVIVSLEKQ